MRPLHQSTEFHQGIWNKPDLQKSSLHLGSHQTLCLRNGVFQKVAEQCQEFNNNSQEKETSVHSIAKGTQLIAPLQVMTIQIPQKL